MLFNFFNEYQTAKEMLRRLQGKFDQIDSRADPLNETKAIGCLHEPFGSQGVA